MKLAPSFFNLLAAAILVTTPLSALANGVEENSLEKRAVWTTCDSWGSSTQGSFTVYQNLWGASAATSGSQCISLDSVSGSTFAWSTTWTWAGGPYNVKSYDNIAYNIATGIKVSTITSIPSTWTWSQTASGTPVNNVAYDLMTTATSDVSGTHTYEIMIWLGAFGGAGPISSSGSPVATPTISGSSWKLYDGYNGSMRVFSFVASSTINSYSGDLNDFLKYLSTNNGFPTSHYLTVLQAGTEPFIGTSVKLTTTKYTVSLTTGTAATTSTTKASTSTTKTSTSTAAGSTGTAPEQCGGATWTGPTVCASGSTCTFSNTWYSQCIPS
ncbi:carbohydrate-binding module family 1 protein [Serendipita vermifera MAFF 305830]|uniref:Carbohydrate-binding module family 1 protein n=1 Tax=Serendipita vermifera MAFF 305830 TaxID=933852 RepID=A0A0C2W2L7_SERVB|nr:carbohydrate-binding module family 1 protein [Serendipita vermifera MAFF 305830]